MWRIIVATWFFLFPVIRGSNLITWTLTGQKYLDVGVDVDGNIYSTRRNDNNEYLLDKIHGITGDVLWSTLTYGEARLAVSTDNSYVYALTSNTIYKHSTVDGNLEWAVSKSNGGMYAAVDRDNMLYVVGSYVTTKYNSSSGALLWQNDHGADDVAAYGSYIYTVDQSCRIMKLRSSDGFVKWSLWYQFGEGGSTCYGIAVVDGDIYVTGYTIGNIDDDTIIYANYNYFAAKVNKDDGAVIWKAHGIFKSETRGYSIAVNNNYVYIVGKYEDNFLFSVLDTNSGSEVGSFHDGKNVARSIAVDVFGNIVIVAGAYLGKNSYCKEHDIVLSGAPFCTGCDVGYYGENFECIECPGISYSDAGASSCYQVKLKLPVYGAVLILLFIAISLVVTCYYLKLDMQHIYVVAVSSVDFLSDIAMILTSRFYNQMYFALIVLFIFAPGVQLLLHMRKQVHKYKRSIRLFFEYPKYILFDLVWISSREGIPYILEKRIYLESVQYVNSFSLSILLGASWFCVGLLQICIALMWCCVHALYLLPIVIVHIPYHTAVFIFGHTLMQTKLLAHPLVYDIWQVYAFHSLVASKDVSTAGSAHVVQAAAEVVSDTSSTKPNSESNIDLGLYNAAALSEVIFESIPQLVLQACNSLMLGEFGVVSIISIASSSYTILSYFYRVFYYYLWCGLPFGEIPLPTPLYDSKVESNVKRNQSASKNATTELVSSVVVSAVLSTTNVDVVKDTVMLRWKDWLIESAKLGEIEATLCAEKLVMLNISTIAKLRYLFETKSDVLDKLEVDDFDRSLIEKALIDV